MWSLGIELRTCGRAASALTIEPSPHLSCPECTAHDQTLYCVYRLYTVILWGGNSPLCFTGKKTDFKDVYGQAEMFFIPLYQNSTHLLSTYYVL